MRQRDVKLHAEAVLLVVELVQRCDQKGWHWDVLLSRAGNDNKYRRTWDNHAGRLTSDQALDLTHWVQTSAYNALQAWGGIQGDPAVE